MREKSALWIRLTLCSLLLLPQPASAAQRPNALAHIATATCFDAWRNITACVPPARLSRVARLRSALPPAWWQAAASSERGALQLVPTGRCPSATQMPSNAGFATAFSTEDTPEMQVDFANFKFDMDVDANWDSLRLAAVHLGYRNCWP